MLKVRQRGSRHAAKMIRKGKGVSRDLQSFISPSERKTETEQ